ncbi:MAG TPA: SDR family oxidoreductase [Acidimicrobiales bacterium]|nr:SDR family oxidoreductase [Acidimicrobiales bacterium]
MSRSIPHPPRRPSIVTGASSGIGLATARALAARGHPVVLGARREVRCQEIAREITTDGGEAHAFALDLGDRDSIVAFVESARAAVGEIDVLVSSAGQNRPDATIEATAGAFAALMGVNLVGAHEMVGLLAPGMIERHHGDMVFVTSENVRSPRPRNKAYVASKWGLEGYARTLQMELEGTGVRASIVQPGQTLSEMGSDWDHEATTEILGEWVRWGLARHGHFLDADAVADAVVTVVEAPVGTHLTMIEVQPEAPVRRDPPASGGAP